MNDEPEGPERVHCECIEGAGACPPEDGNGCDEMHPGMFLSTCDDSGTMTIDTLWVENNGKWLFVCGVIITFIYNSLKNSLKEFLIFPFDMP